MAGQGVRADRLTAMAVAKAKEPGLYPDGRGLYLQITPRGALSWIFRYRYGDKRRDMGLGPLKLVTLAGARAKADDARRLLKERVDPLEARKMGRAEQVRATKAAEAEAMTFEAAATACIEDMRSGWRNEKHADQWMATLKLYAFPVIGNVAVANVDSAQVLRIVRPIWTKKTETASRVRGRIETVLDWAKANGYRGGENPARWRGGIGESLPKRSKVKQVRHFPALPYAQMGTFMQALQKEGGTSPRALELLILTAARTGEIINAIGEEFDLSAKVWVIPGERTKQGREHRVALSDAAVKLLKTLRPQNGKFLFPTSANRNEPLSDNAMLVLLERMERGHITVHGFRSTFRDWAAEQTNFPGEVCEMALGHAVGDDTEQAYRRTDLLEKRRLLMEAWAKYCATPSQAKGKVTAFRGRRT